MSAGYKRPYPFGWGPFVSIAKGVAQNPKLIKGSKYNILHYKI